MSVTVSPASVVGLPVSAAVAGANQGSAAASSALQSASPASVDAATAVTQANDFEAILSPMLAAAGVASPTLTTTSASASLPAPDAVSAALPPGGDPVLPLQALMTASGVQGSSQPPDGNNLPGLVDDPADALAVALGGEFDAATGEQSLLPAKNETATTLSTPTSADDAQEDLASSDLSLSLMLPMPQADPSASRADDVANAALPDALPSVDASVLAANVVPPPTPVAPSAATAVAQAPMMPLSVSDQPAAKLGVTDTANTNAITAAPSDEDKLPVDVQTLALDMVAPSTDGAETASVDKETFGRLLASSQLADSITGNAQRSDAAMSSAESVRPPSGAIAYRLQGQEMVATTLVPQSFDSDSWGNEIGERVVWFSSNHIQHAEIELDPPELGPLQVRISTQNDQTTVSFTSHHAAVREVLDQNLPKLKELFADQGLNLVQADVSERRSPSQDHHGGGSSDNTGNGELSADDDVAAVEADVRPAMTARRGLIDAFA